MPNQQPCCENSPWLMESKWPYRVEVNWPSDREIVTQWLEQNFEHNSWFWAAWSVLYFSHQGDATRTALIWGT